MGRSQSDYEPQAHAPSPSISRTATWPLLLKRPIDLEAEEARKRSAHIDKQIEADSSVIRNRCSVLLLGLSCDRECKMLLTDGFATLSNMSGVEEKLDPAPIRKHLHLEAERMASIARDVQIVGGDDSPYVRALGDRLNDGKLQALDGEVADLITKLWSSENYRKVSSWRGRPEAYDKM
jgi:hypothetical protein